MRTLRPLLAGAVAFAMLGTLSLSGTAEDEADQPADESPPAASTEGTTTSDSPGEVTAVGNLVYATGSSPDAATELMLLLLHPASRSEDGPMVIDVGGSAVDPQALAERGVSVFSVLFFPDQWPEVKQRADPTALRAMAEAVACAVRFARGSEYGSEAAPLVLTGWSAWAGPPSHVALTGEDFDRVWEEYAESAGGPPAQYDCTAGEASTRVDGFVGVAGAYDTYVGYEGKYGRDFLLEHEPDLWEMLWSTVGLHPELRVRLIHGDADSTIPLENSAAFEAVLAEAGYDVELVEFAGGHGAPPDLVLETVVDLVAL